MSFSNHLDYHRGAGRLAVYWPCGIIRHRRPPSPCRWNSNLDHSTRCRSCAGGTRSGTTREEIWAKNCGVNCTVRFLSRHRSLWTESFDLLGSPGHGPCWGNVHLRAVRVELSGAISGSGSGSWSGVEYFHDGPGDNLSNWVDFGRSNWSVCWD